MGESERRVALVSCISSGLGLPRWSRLSTRACSCRRIEWSYLGDLGYMGLGMFWDITEGENSVLWAEQGVFLAYRE